MTDGFAVEPDVLDQAAGAIRTAVEDGTTQTQCLAWGNGYGHDALSAAVVTFTTDADRGVVQLSEKAEALAVGLELVADAYREADAGVQSTFTGPVPTPSPGPSPVPTGGR